MCEPLPPNLHLGTSSWSTKDWYSVFYPAEHRPSEFITYYARHYQTVEIDATFYRQPSPRMVRAWDQRTPDGFTFAAKVPQVITHEKGLVNCESEITLFLHTMSRLGGKLGPLLLQFPYVAKRQDALEYKTGQQFLQRLKQFLPRLPQSGFRFAVEVRNPNWLKPPLLELLSQHDIALALSCYYTMPSLTQLMQELDIVTSELTYIRFLGHHRRMESIIDSMIKDGRKQRKWDELVVDRSLEMRQWITSIRQLVTRGIDVYVYFNNHYAGFAPGSVESFKEIWQDQGQDEREEPGDAGASTAR